MAIPRNLANFAAFANAGAAGPSIQGLTAGRGAGAIATNTAFGTRALISNTTGTSNIAIGGGDITNQGPLEANTIGAGNIAIGVNTLRTNTTGSNNTCIGHVSGDGCVTGTKNVAVYGGDLNGGNRLSAGSVNVVTLGTGDQEVFRFTPALSTQLDGLNAGRGSGRVSANTVFGFRALLNNTTGTRNVAIGGLDGANGGALEANTVGFENIAVGASALSYNTSGSKNICIGYAAGIDVTTGKENVVVFSDTVSSTSRLAAGTTNTVAVGSAGVAGVNIRITTTGFTSQKVFDETTGSAANVFVAADGKMSRSTSSQRYKKNIQDAVHGLDKVLQLRPVTFNHINPDEDGIVYGGLIAEEVHDLGLTEFVEYTWDGKPDSLRYGHMVSVLVKAVQELNARVVALETQGA